MNKETSFSIENLKNRILSNELIIGAVKNICQMIKKRSAIILTLFLLIINPALFGQLVDIICGVFNKTSYLFPVAVIETVISIAILIKVSKRLSTRRDVLYFCVLLALLYRKVFLVDAIEGATYILAFALFAYISFIKRKYIVLIPFICLGCEVFSDQFVNEYLISFFVFYLLYRDSNEIYLGKEEKVTIFISFAIYIVCAVLGLCMRIDTLRSSSLTWQYYNDYFKFGFGARGLIATIRWMIVGGTGSINSTFCFILASHIISIILILTLILFAIKNNKVKDGTDILLICSFLCSLPFRNLGDNQMIMYFDCILILIAVLSTIIIIKGKYLVALVPLTFIAMCLHHGYAFFIFPAIVTILMFKYLSEQGKMKKRMLAIGMILILIVAGTFFYFHFLAYRNNNVSYEEACQYMAECTEREFTEEILELDVEDMKEQEEFFYINIDYIMYDGKVDNMGVQKSTTVGLINSIILNIVFLPILFTIFMIFRDRKCTNSFDKFLNLVSPFIICIFYLSYIEVDYGRWDSFLIFNVLLELTAFYTIQRNDICIDSIGVDNRNALCRVLVLFMMMVPNMGVFGA